MQQIEHMLDLLRDQHPVWWRVLVRLAICVLWSLFGVAIVLMVFLFCAPIAMVLKESNGSLFWLWVIEPFLGALCWCCASAACWLLDNVM